MGGRIVESGPGVGYPGPCIIEDSQANPAVIYSRVWGEVATATNPLEVVPRKASKLQLHVDRTANRHRWAG
jgi:hypothetical protein